MSDKVSIIDDINSYYSKYKYYVKDIFIRILRTNLSTIKSTAFSKDMRSNNVLFIILDFDYIVDNAIKGVFLRESFFEVAKYNESIKEMYKLPQKKIQMIIKIIVLLLPAKNSIVREVLQILEFKEKLNKRQKMKARSSLKNNLFMQENLGRQTKKHCKEKLINTLVDEKYNEYQNIGCQKENINKSKIQSLKYIDDQKTISRENYVSKPIKFLNIQKQNITINLEDPTDMATQIAKDTVTTKDEFLSPLSIQKKNICKPAAFTGSEVFKDKTDFNEKLDKRTSTSPMYMSELQCDYSTTDNTSHKFNTYSNSDNISIYSYGGQTKSSRSMNNVMPESNSDVYMTEISPKPIDSGLIINPTKVMNSQSAIIYLEKFFKQDEVQKALNNSDKLTSDSQSSIESQNESKGGSIGFEKKESYKINRNLSKIVNSFCDQKLVNAKKFKNHKLVHSLSNDFIQDQDNTESSILSKKTKRKNKKKKSDTSVLSEEKVSINRRGEPIKNKAHKEENSDLQNNSSIKMSLNNEDNNGYEEESRINGLEYLENLINNNNSFKESNILATNTEQPDWNCFLTPYNILSPLPSCKTNLYGEYNKFIFNNSKTISNAINSNKYDESPNFYELGKNASNTSEYQLSSASPKKEIKADKFQEN